MFPIWPGTKHCWINFAHFYIFILNVHICIYKILCKPLLSECLGIFFWYNILTHNSQLFITRVICIKIVIYFCHYFDVLIACNYAYFINVQLSYDVFLRCCKILFLTWINEVIVKDNIVCWFYFNLYKISSK